MTLWSFYLKYSSIAGALLSCRRRRTTDLIAGPEGWRNGLNHITHTNDTLTISFVNAGLQDMKIATFTAMRERWGIPLTLSVLILSLTACEALGPTALRAGRNEYNSAINTTDVQEFLLNIVRMRFNDKPYVLEISTISARSEWGARVDAAYERRDPRSGRNTRSRSSNADYTEFGVGASLSYLEKPSIVYQPLKGDKFVHQMLSPLDLETMFLLRFSGWQMSQILRVFARAVNDVPNAPTAGASTPTGIPEYEAFLGAINAMAELEKNGGIIYALVGKTRKGHRKDELAVRVLPSARQSPAFLKMTRTFKLDPEAKQYRMKIGWGPEGPGALVVETRPVLSAMFYVGRGIEIPQSVINAGMAHVTLDEDDQPFDWNRVLQGLIRIRSSSERPSNAYTAVRYGGYWYYIKNNDIASKETLTMLSIVFTLKSGGQRRAPPVITLPIE